MGHLGQYGRVRPKGPFQCCMTMTIIKVFYTPSKILTSLQTKCSLSLTKELGSWEQPSRWSLFTFPLASITDHHVLSHRESSASNALPCFVLPNIPWAICSHNATILFCRQEPRRGTASCVSLKGSRWSMVALCRTNSCELKMQTVSFQRGSI